MLSSEAESRLIRAHCSLEGLSVGDAFGERFFVHPANVGTLIGSRALPAAPWRYTDDTQMALSIVATLKNHNEIKQDKLARSFGLHYDISRGYGPAMHLFLPRIRSGKRWSEVARSLFSGQGSFGNGAAMRVAPLGAYFADDLDAVIAHAAKSAEVTHAHAEAVAGAIAVALAAAYAYRASESGELPDPQTFMDLVIANVPASKVREGIELARALPSATTIQAAIAALGNGSKVSAQDTVPFTIWSAAHHLANYEEALWATVSGLGDRDTTCAIVDGIVACYTGSEAIPQEWHEAREPLPDWWE